MSPTADDSPRNPATAEARRLAELAYAAGFGGSPQAALQWTHDAIGLIGSDEETPLLADVLRWQGSVLRDVGRTTEAEPLYQRSLELATKLAYDPGRAHALNCLAGLEQRRGHLTEATNQLSDALSLADACGETRLVGMIQQNLGVLADIRGNPAAALAHYRVSLHTFEETNDLQPIVWVLNNLGYLLGREGKRDEAREMFSRGLRLARARGDLMSEGIIQENLGELLLLEGSLQAALDAIHQSLEIAKRRRDQPRQAAALKLRGAYERLAGNAGEAVNTLRRALAIAESGEDALLGAEIQYQLGNALAVVGDPDEARHVWKRALEAFERIAARQWVGRTRQRLTDGATGEYL